MDIKKGTLLIVDDEEGIVQVVNLTMKKYAEKIFTAKNGAEGLQIIKENKIDLVLSDIRMPVMDGLELIKEVRKFDQKIPFVFYTAFGNRHLMMEALKYGAEDFVDKPMLTGLKEILIKVLHKDTGSETKSNFESEYQKVFVKKGNP